VDFVTKFEKELRKRHHSLMTEVAKIASHAKDSLAKHFVTLLLLTVPTSSGWSNFCGYGGDSPPSGITPYDPIVCRPRLFQRRPAR
jgi:hypothetical protein